MCVNTFIERHGLIYSVERNSVSIAEYKGLINREESTNKRYIGFYPNTEIEIGDWLINPTGDRFLVIDKETITNMGKPYQLKCMIQTEADSRLANNDATVFNIHNAYGSVIGSQSSVVLNYNDSIQKAKEQIETSNSSDKEELKQIISLLEMITNNQVPVNKGLFSKFSDVMERNSWITSSIASALLSWLTTQIS